MSLSSQAKRRMLRPVLAGLLAALFVGMTLLSASERLHLQLHAEGDGHGHSPCAVCALVNSQIDTPSVGVSELFAALSLAWTLPIPSILPPSVVEFSAAPNRGPPSSVSSSL